MTLPHDGTVRVFHYYVPTILQPNKSLPSLITLHSLKQAGASLAGVYLIEMAVMVRRLVVE
jgi:poly(3-hydroxybutyrate) depolymerase